MKPDESGGLADALCWDQNAVWTVKANRAEIVRWERQGILYARTALDDARMRVAADGDRIHVIKAEGPTYSRRPIFSLAEQLHGALIGLAAAMGGFILPPVMPIYREAELAFMLRDSGARLMFIPASFRNHDLAAILTRLQDRLPGLDHVVVVRAAKPGRTHASTRLLQRSFVHLFANVNPDDIRPLMYTSGTTDKAKGVLHSHARLGAETLAQRDYGRSRHYRS